MNLMQSDDLLDSESNDSDSLWIAYDGLYEVSMKLKKKHGLILEELDVIKKGREELSLKLSKEISLICDLKEKNIILETNVKDLKVE